MPAGGVGVVTASCTSHGRAGLSTISLTPSYDAVGVTAYVGRGENATTEARTFSVHVLCYPH